MQSPVSAGRSRPCFQRRAPSLDKRLSFVQHQLLFTCHSDRSEESCILPVAPASLQKGSNSPTRRNM